MTLRVRPARLDEIAQLEQLIRDSVRLQVGDYTEEQIAGALGTVFGIDRQMVGDGTYFVVEADGELAACGGWSARRTPFGGDRSPEKDDSFLDPLVDAARIRAFFVRPAFARRGIGRLLYETCRSAAEAKGFRRLQLTATLTGVPLYRALEFAAEQRFELPLPNGASLPVVLMTKSLLPDAV